MALEISRGSATFPPVTTGPSGRISGAAGAAILEEIIPGSALPLELSTEAPASSAGAATCSAASVRCALSGCATAADPPRIAAILFTGGFTGTLAAAGDLLAVDEPALTVTAGAPEGTAVATGPLTTDCEAEFCKAVCSAATCWDWAVDCDSGEELPFVCERKYSPPPTTTASNKQTQTAIIIKLVDRGAPCTSSDESSALSSRAAEEDRAAPKLAPPLRLPKTARELSAGFSSIAGDCS